MLKYLIPIIVGIILFFILNNKDGFSIGIPITYTVIATRS